MFFLLFYHLCNCAALAISCPAVAASIWCDVLPWPVMVNFFYCATYAFSCCNQYSFTV